VNERLGWEPLERRVLGEGVASGVLIVTILAVFGGLDGIELAALTVVTAVSLLLDVHLPQGGSVPLGYALLIALAYLLPGGDYLLVVLFSVLLALPVLHRRLGAPGAGATGLRWLLAALAAGATAHLAAGLGLGVDHNTKILVCVALGGVAFLTADLLTARFTSAAGEERVNAGSAWPVYVTLLSAAALLALADRFEHGGSTGSPWLSAIAFCPLLITRFSFERYAQASRTYRQSSQALSIVPEVAGMSRPGHGERTAAYAASLADELGVLGDDREQVITAARLHRIGYIGLDGEEEEAPDSVDPRRVARVGAEMLRQTGFLRRVADIVEEVELHSADGGTLGAAIVRIASRFDDQVVEEPARMTGALEIISATTTDPVGRQVLSGLKRLLVVRPGLVDDAILAGSPVTEAAASADLISR
jgi:putative nucleotidyltransferase with HDIG domain